MNPSSLILPPAVWARGCFAARREIIPNENTICQRRSRVRRRSSWKQKSGAGIILLTRDFMAIPELSFSPLPPFSEKSPHPPKNSASERKKYRRPDTPSRGSSFRGTIGPTWSPSPGPQQRSGNNAFATPDESEKGIALGYTIPETTFDETSPESCPYRYNNHYKSNIPVNERPKISADCGTGIISVHSFHPPQNHPAHKL